MIHPTHAVLQVAVLGFESAAVSASFSSATYVEGIVRKVYRCQFIEHVFGTRLETVTLCCQGSLEFGRVFELV